MANAATKKLAAANVQTLLSHRFAFLAVHMVFILVRLVFRRSSATSWLYFMYILTTALSTFVQVQLELVGRPKYDQRGQVLQSGSDLGQAGLTEYMWDFIYLTWAIQLLVAFTTTWAWSLYFLIPGYAGTKIWEFYSARQSRTPAAPEQPEKPTKSQRKVKRQRA